MTEIALGVALFTAIVMCLALVILAARAKLMAGGKIAVTVNGERTLKAPAGEKLLGVLTDAGIPLPSACGGVGTCGLCRVTVLEGGGVILPVEAERITRQQAAAGLRLACQVTMHEDLKIRVPEEIFGAKL